MKASLGCIIVGILLAMGIQYFITLRIDIFQWDEITRLVYLCILSIGGMLGYVVWLQYESR